MTTPLQKTGTNPEFDRLLSVAEQLVSQKQLTPSLLISLGGTLAVEVNRVAGLSGQEKKQLVCDVVKKVVQKSVGVPTDVSGAVVAVVVSAEVKEKLDFVVDSVLPASLDLAVAAARGKFDLKKTKKTCFSLLVACLPSALGVCGVSQPQAKLVLEQVEKIAEKVDPDLAQSDDTTSIEAVGSSQETIEQNQILQSQSKGKEVLELREVVTTLPTENQIV